MLRLTAILLLALQVSCANDDDPDEGSDTGLNLIFVTWDGVRVKEFEGKRDRGRAKGPVQTILPHFWSSIARMGNLFGTKMDGAVMLAGNPHFLSLPGYQAITAGSTQNCTNNQCGRIETKTVIEKLARTYQLDPRKVATISSWETLQNAVESKQGITFVNAGNNDLDDGSGSEEVRQLNELQRNNPPKWANARRDIYTQKQAMSYLARNEPRFLWIALNDTDEWAHLDQYDEYLEALNQNDSYLNDLFSFIDNHPTYRGKTCVILTTDHGRGSGNSWTNHSNGLPSAGIVWMYSYCPGRSSQIKTSVGKVVTHLNIRPTIEDIFGLRRRNCQFCGGSFADVLGERFSFVRE